ncbi:signal transduction histidine kinase [Owenweeksia hongkongensis DSM 17368]|uniref:histidine kinase n=1 Tax=Owenweeksia hongkongensis (strain DSM 17368 / CIP 108786 / JCM 12287 / NRRL B-23963 / UST20020801) TaxID=926562 RepID=G8R7T4_OWEHD|nr:HAMP domain-containing sensor histidine kinase [Owenweeksia hongkongensis]AEV33465.1 signal transduction histidine kinase [Owenweeksia hongkongensis DSM 17368]
MKLVNQSLKYLSISILLIVAVWASVFYINMLHEIKGSIDEGLENYKRLIILNTQKDSTILTKTYFDESFFTIKEIEKEHALSIKDRYIDTLIYMQDADDEELEAEPVRMLSTAFENNGRFYELKIANSMVEEDDLIKTLLWDIVWLYIILIASIILINNIVLKKLWKPFYNFLQQLKNYRLGNTPNLPHVQTKTKEFTDLQEAVNTLLERTIATYEQQKEFIGNASHELQTPLAIAINKLELLLEKGDLQDSQAESVAEVFQIIERLIRLNKSLLLLSKIDNKQFFDNQSISINELVQQNVSDLGEFADYKNIDISVSEKHQLTVHMDASLANIVVSNLLKNALFHNMEGGSVQIDLLEHLLKISNTGKAQSLDAKTIFNRFQKSDSETTGTGLGLAIVKAILDLQDFTLQYSFENNLHCFEINFRKP